MFTLEELINLGRIPQPFEPGEELWNDPHISTMMLKAHLSPDTDAASYRPQKINAICEYIVRATGIQSGSPVADLGCGPGLYCEKLAQKGFLMAGIDRSENSIQYASRNIRDKNTSFILTSYLEPFGANLFEAALMVSQDYGVLSPANRIILLANIHKALKPKGYFVFDVSGMAAYEKRKNDAGAKWYASGPDFWRPHKHFVLEKTIFYPDTPVLCDFIAVFDSLVKAYHIYQTFFSPESISSELEDNGFKVKAILSNLCGEEYHASSPEIGVLAQKA